MTSQTPPPSTVASLSLLLLDDQQVFTESLALSLDLEPDIRCVARASTARDGLAMAAVIDFAAAVVDLRLPDADGIEVIEGIREMRPAARVLILTAHPHADLARRALAAGAVAFLSKDTRLARIIDALRHADAERPFVDSDPRGEHAVTIGLTPREYDVLRQLGQGHDARRTAAALGMSVYTARDHIKALMAKLGAHTQLEAVVRAERLGLINIGSRY